MKFKYNTDSPAAVKRDIERNLDAARTVHQVRPDVHWVEMNYAGKIPARKGWQRDENKPSFDDIVKIIRNRRMVGVIPFSLKAVVIDVDAGDFYKLADAYPPRILLPTRRGAHLYYDADEKTPDSLMQRKITIRGSVLKVDALVGKTSTSRRFCKIHGGGLPLLANALLDKEKYDFPARLFPEEVLFDREGHRVPAEKKWWIETPRTLDGSIDLGKVVENRNNTLFAMCCHKDSIGRAMYKRGDIQTVDDLIALVLWWRSQLPMPKEGEEEISREEAIRIARSAFRYLSKPTKRIP